MTSDSKFRIAVRRFGPFESAIRKQWENFEATFKTGLELELYSCDLGALSDVVFSEQQKDSAPWDVIFINTDWVAAVHAGNKVVDLQPFLDADPPEGYPEAWTSSLLRYQDVNGFVTGLPYHDGPESLIFRRDLFEDEKEQEQYRQQFGRPLLPPKTWSEFQDVARFFHRPQQGLYGTVFAAFPDGHNTVYDFLLQLWTRGGELFGPDGKINLQTDEARSALTFYRSILRDQTALHPRSHSMDSVQSGQAFTAGEVAMMVNWFGFAAMSETVQESKVKGRVDLASIPSTSGLPGASLNVYWLLAIPASCTRTSLAFSFLRYCASSSMDKLLTLEGGIGCRKSTWNDPEVRRAIPFYERLEALHQNAREMPRRAEWPEVAHVIDQVVLRAINTDDSVDVILRDGDEDIRRILS
jgi:multiple sugar transport system substrate-binding protein